MANSELRPIQVVGNIAYVTLTKGYTAVIDVDYVPLVDVGNWAALTPSGSQSVYAYRRPWSGGRQGMVYMHRLICAAPSGIEVDHINGNGLDNRKSNLRLATRSENERNKPPSCVNTSGYKGVIWHPQSKKWRAVIHSSSKRIHLGLFDKVEDAAAAYASAAVIVHGQFMRLK